MKLAILGDIHGNIEALKAAHAAALAWGPDRIFHLGDLGGYAPSVNEVVEFLEEHEIDGVQGNYDFNVATDAEHCGCKYEDPFQAELATRSYEWTKAHTSAASRAHMAALPKDIRFQAGGLNVMLFHATPHKNNLYWFEDREDKFFLEMAQKSGAQVMIYGHTHKPYRKDIDGMVFINAGSVGKPKDGDPRACVALVSINASAVQCEFLRVSYDVDKVAESILKSGLPIEFAEKLRQGK